MSENEIIVPIGGYEKIKVKRCKHKQLVTVVKDEGDFVHCADCGLRTPVVPIEMVRGQRRYLKKSAKRANCIETSLD